ncbi:MAG TPA: PEP-CTERM/exosortase system-associated acyltransferase [Thiohalobacter sp.]|nr:PEP-CTERM/exosortase system-associated acyltransferase [Thiohalobacter sp.]
MDLLTGFYRYLEGMEATTEPLRERAHRVRYEVYCLERGFEDPAAFPDGRECDAYDARSLQALVQQRSTGYPAGVVRLIQPDPDDIEAPFPVELHCAGQLDRKVIDRFGVDRAHLAEVSRFAVARGFKRRPGESGTVAGVSGDLGYATEQQIEDARRIFPHISLGLIAMLFVMSRRQGITHWYAVMEPSLSRLLTRFGINFTPIGPIVDYRGRRQPMIARPEQLLETIQHKRPDFRALIDSLSGDQPTLRTPASRSVAG